jgi:hypothetical protein
MDGILDERPFVHALKCNFDLSYRLCLPEPICSIASSMVSSGPEGLCLVVRVPQSVCLAHHRMHVR